MTGYRPLVPKRRVRLARAVVVGWAVCVSAVVAACSRSGPGSAASVDASSIPIVSKPPIGVTTQPPPASAATYGTGSSPTTAHRPATASPSHVRSRPVTSTQQIVRPPRTGDGRFRTAPLAVAAGVTGRLVRYAVQVEGGVPVDPLDFARQVHATLTDPRGWQSVDGVAFEAVADPSEAAFIVTLATPVTTDRLCAPLDTGGWLDCFNGSRAVINSDRWLLGATSWSTDITGYRHEVLNHEVGHALGHGHAYCPTPGAPAPVMQQQTISLQGCTPNGWPSVTHG
jgi:hypothetical protein